MRIRKLELHGFKSFPDRTTLHFGEGISCIVGPNGCGKSNIVDALRWCIGEQSARSLRGSEMMDVIFAGSQIRKPVGFAEVTLTLTSDGGEPFPGEYAQMLEVSVGRRLHRTGASEYFLNQTRVRRRDVQDLFLDTGVGNNLYSFIEQGRIGKIVHARPEERRSLIDEAAGISRYKIRRDEARERLTATATQLDRAADVADEMARRVRVLTRQVIKAGRFRRLRAHIRQDEIALSLAKYQALSQDRRALRARLRALEGELTVAQRNRARREADLTTRREELGVVEAGVETWRDEVAELDAHRRELEGARGFAARRLSELQDEARRATEQLQAAEQAATEARQAQETAAASVELAVQHRQAADATLASCQQALDALSQELTTRREAARTARLEANRTLLESERLGSEASELVRRAEALPQRAQDLQRDLMQAQDACTAAMEAAEAAEDRLTRARRDSDEVEASRTQAQAVVEAHRLAEEAARHAVVEAERRERERQSQAHQASKALERALREAEDALRGERSQAERAIEAAVAGARRQAEAEVQRQRSAQEARLQASRQRAQTWLDALGQHARSVEAALVVDLDRRGQHADADHKARVDDVRQTAERDIQGAISAAREAGAAEVAARTSDLQSVEDGLASLRAQVEPARTAHRASQAARATAQAESARLEALIAAATSSLGGQTALRRALPDALPLVERLSADAREVPWVSAALGERLGLLAVAPEQVQTVVAALDQDQAAQVILRAPGALDAQGALGGVALVEDLEQAVAHHLATGGAAVVRDTGERLDADGRLHLGRAAADAGDLLQWTRDREQAERDEHQAVEGAATHAAHLQSLQDAIEVAEAERLGARRALEEARAAVDRQVREAEIGARRQLEDRLADLRHEVDASRETLRTLRTERLEATRRRHESARRAAVEQRDQALVWVEHDGAERLQTARTAVAERESEARALAEQQAAERVALLEASEASARQALRAHQDQVQHDLTQAEAPLLDLREKAASARTALETARQQLQEISERAGAAALFATRSEASRTAAVDALQRARRAVDDARGKVNHLEGEQAILASRRVLVAERQQAATHAAEAAEQRAALAESSLGATETQAAAAREDLSAAQLETVTWTERENAARAARDAAAARLAEAHDRAEAARASLEACERGRQTASTNLVEAESGLEASATRRAEAWDRLERERERLGALRDGVQNAEKDLRELIDGLAESTGRIEQMRADLDNARSEVESLQRRMDERYQVRLPGLLDQMDAHGRLVLEPDPLAAVPLEVDGTTLEAVPTVTLTPGSLTDTDEVEARIERVAEARRELEKIGDVNLAAYDEFVEVGARHSELEAQRADLEASVDRIRSAIAKMNRTCRQRFRDTFDLVNAHFQEMYPRLVGGGSARLSLTNEDDLLETGVDIFVQPPGKRLQNLSLLSGGEKAMTAIALILSLFKVKPSPFCVLDEVDAPLDEANGSRFNEALKEMAAISQFIVITHNRKTMECAQTLYGITMPDPGVSSLVSVQVGD